MKSNFNQHNLSQAAQKTRSLSMSGGSKPRSTFPQSLSELNDLNLEKQLRSFVQERAALGDYAIAIAILDQLIALCPDNAADYNNRGLMYFHNNQIVEALGDLSQALEINPKLDSAYNNRANCLAFQGELAEAIADYDLALDLNPANLHAWINQGISFRELEMYNLALENFDITLIIGNSLEERIYAERGRTYHLQGDWNCAVSDYQTALEMLANQPKLVNYTNKVISWFDQLLYPLFNI